MPLTLLPTVSRKFPSATSRFHCDASRKNRALPPSVPRTLAKVSTSSSWSSTFTPAKAAIKSSRSDIAGPSQLYGDPAPRLRRPSAHPPTLGAATTAQQQQQPPSFVAASSGLSYAHSNPRPPLALSPPVGERGGSQSAAAPCGSCARQQHDQPLLDEVLASLVEA